MSYQLYINNKQEGPFDNASILQMFKDGKITAETLGWKEGLTDWVAIGNLVELSVSTTAISSDKPLNNDRNGSIIDKLVSEEQDPAAVEKVVKKITDILTSEEQIEYVGVQKKPVVTISPDSIILTNKRIIIARPKLTGFKFEDYQWRDVKDVHMSEQMMGATITCSTTSGQTSFVESVPKKQARRIYAYAQQIEENMIEERREREMEEKRAGAGGVVIQAPLQAPSNQTINTEDPIEQLGKLKKMLDTGLIDQNDFDIKKAEIMARI